MSLSNYWSEEKVEKLLKDLEIAENNVIEQHELNFQKALDQATSFYNIPLDKGKFVVDKDFYEGKLLPIDQILSARELVLALLGTLEAERIDLEA